jgi:Zn-dependent peptidase ImmA (M78 family)
MDDYDGYCYMYRRRIFIRIDKSLSEEDAIETLQHEIAHALQTKFWCRYCKASDRDKDRMLDECHDAEWGMNYAKVYSVYERNFT